LYQTDWNEMFGSQSCVVASVFVPVTDPAPPPIVEALFQLSFAGAAAEAPVEKRPIKASHKIVKIAFCLLFFMIIYLRYKIVFDGSAAVYISKLR
jgi:hypothetical protein